jgi:hypothetical protein
MHGLLRLSIAALILAGSPALAFQEGITCASWAKGQYRSGKTRASLEALANTGAEWLAVVRPYYQRTIYETRMVPEIDALGRHHTSPSEEDVEAMVRWAHERGLKVMLVPHVKVLADGQWKGMIGDDFSEAEWAAWFASYEAFIAEQAKLAQRLGVEQLSLGNELKGTSHREREWRSVIATARAAFSGRLTYAAHHDEIYRIAWWDALDAIGIDAYWDLINDDDPTVEELVEAWRPHGERLRDLAKRWNKKVIFTEVGFRSVDGGVRKPWNYGSGGAVDLQEQADAYESVFRAFFDAPWCDGFYWWAWDESDGEGDTSYTPHGKPAEDILRAWYKGEKSETDWVYRDGEDSPWRASAWSGSLDLQAPGGRYGSNAFSAQLEPVGGVTFQHDALDAEGLGGIELYVKAPRGLPLEISLETAAGEESHTVEGQGSLTRIRLPFPGLAQAAGGRVRINLADLSGEGVSLRLDDVRLIPWTGDAEHEPSDFLANFLDALRNLFQPAASDDAPAATTPAERAESVGIAGVLSRGR